MAAEISRSAGALRPARWRFNEAAANGRGNRRSPRSAASGTKPGFNEAAANGRGNRPGPLDVVRVQQVASMRPRRMAAEITSPPRTPAPRWTASMRPRRMAAEISESASGGPPGRTLQ